MKDMEKEISKALAEVAKCDHQGEIKDLIFTVRGVQVMLDRDLARLYQVQTKVLNQAVKRNVQRFPERFMFQLTEVEMNELVTNCDRLKSLKHSASPATVFTEQGVYLLGASVKDMGKGLCAIAPVGFPPEVVLGMVR